MFKEVKVYANSEQIEGITYLFNGKYYPFSGFPNEDYANDLVNRNKGYGSIDVNQDNLTYIGSYEVKVDE